MSQLKNNQRNNQKQHSKTHRKITNQFKKNLKHYPKKITKNNNINNNNESLPQSFLIKNNLLKLKAICKVENRCYCNNSKKYTKTQPHMKKSNRLIWNTTRSWPKRFFLLWIVFSITTCTKTSSIGQKIIKSL